MNIWDEVKAIKTRSDHTLKYVNDPTQSAIDRARLLEFIEQFRPHPFDPQDRGAWPEIGKEVIVRHKTGKRLFWSLVKVEIGSFFWFDGNECYNLTDVKEWQNLPGTEE